MGQREKRVQKRAREIEGERGRKMRERGRRAGGEREGEGGEKKKKLYCSTETGGRRK